MLIASVLFYLLLRVRSNLLAWPTPGLDATPPWPACSWPST
ncbi:hypothetical protein NWF32_01130 [Pseudomonas qingdaonensis]|nr:hypothetical protein [Pseudomonas qingdaonensis]